MNHIEILKTIIITEDELIFKASRSSGPGGQNVNKLNTRISVFYNIKESDKFSDIQKKRVLRNLSTRIDNEGFIRVVSQKHRSQNANREAALERLRELLENAIKPEPIRKKTKVPFSAKRKRLEDKKFRSKLKQQRSEKDFDI